MGYLQTDDEKDAWIYSEFSLIKTTMEILQNLGPDEIIDKQELPLCSWVNYILNLRTLWKITSNFDIMFFVTHLFWLYRALQKQPLKL